MRRFIDFYNGEVARWQASDKKTMIDDFVSYDDKQIKWSSSLKAELKRGKLATFDEAKIRSSLYRPFCKKSLYFDEEVLVHRPGLFGRIFPTPETKNRVMVISDIAARTDFSVLMTDCIPDLHLCSSDAYQCFPLYTFSADGNERFDNITGFALQAARAVGRSRDARRYFLRDLRAVARARLSN